jgi:hypothetical protein
MSDTPQHRALTDDECKIVKRIERLARAYDDICKMLYHISGSMSQNDWYFMQHSFQLREDAARGRPSDPDFIKEMNDDSQVYYEEIMRIKELLQRALGLTTVREIAFVDDKPDIDEDDEDALPVG